MWVGVSFLSKSVAATLALLLLGCGGGFGEPGEQPDARPWAADAAPLIDAPADAQPVLVPARCDDGDARVADGMTGNCYLRFNDIVTWTIASARCQAAGAHLVSIATAEEDAVVAQVAPDAGGLAPDAWIGANDIAAEGTWAWEVTAEPFVFEHWRDGEPNNTAAADPTGEDCAVFEGDSLEWDDRSCTMLSFAFICEREATFE